MTVNAFFVGILKVVFPRREGEGVCNAPAPTDCNKNFKKEKNKT